MAKSSVVAFSRRSENTPVQEVSVSVARRPGAVEQVTSEPGVDLSGKPKVIVLIGRGRTGKTTLARWVIERGQGAGRKAVLAALDPVNRTLESYFRGVEVPEDGTPEASAKLLRDLLEFAMEQKQSVVADLGAGSTALGTVLEEIPDLGDLLAGSGVPAVALYLLAPDVEDKTPFVSLGFRPEATAFVCNRGAGDGSFRNVLGQAAIREAIEAGARVVHMPRLDPALMKEMSESEPRLSFAAGAQLPALRGAQVRNWLRSMDQAFAGIGTWLA